MNPTDISRALKERLIVTKWQSAHDWMQALNARDERELESRALYAYLVREEWSNGDRSVGAPAGTDFDNPELFPRRAAAKMRAQLEGGRNEELDKALEAMPGLTRYLFEGGQG